MSTLKRRQSRAKLRAAVFGLGSIALYGTLYAFSDTILHYCARGGFYNVLPIGAVFLFSYVHGSFASNAWTALGIEASLKSTKKATKETTPEIQQPARERAVAS